METKKTKQFLFVIGCVIAFVICNFGKITFLQKNGYRDITPNICVHQDRGLHRRIMKNVDGKSNLFVHFQTGYHDSEKTKTSSAVSRKHNKKSEYDIKTMAVHKGANKDMNVRDNNTSINQNTNIIFPVIVRDQRTTTNAVPLTVSDNPYLINNRYICTGSEDKLFLILVHTATDHVKRRNSYRETWANISAYQNYNMRVVFLLGIPKDDKSQAALQEENNMHRDIVQGTFRDTYHNLTHKGVLGLRWTTENCKQAKFVVKVDDDVFVNVLQLMTTIFEKHWNATRQIMGLVKWNGTDPVRRKGKWKVQAHEFTNITHYMTHCKGFFVIFTGDIIQELYAAARVTPLFWIDDIYLFGMLPEKVGHIKFVQLEGLTVDEKTGMRFIDSKAKPFSFLVTGAHSDGVMAKLWQNMCRQNKLLAKKFLKS